ncbi:universal stress protein [Chryseolinea sp. H1M3-3]|uniref:universal stress protein n=1 Tax=Chryseolinea sp. H1M3-3 TaxID=3034144 RepID=UPI0023ED643B|nr:universal stress protein [Chryseolinea sp. H1M3-3]
MKKILVPCDFSKPAVNAFRFALDVAERSKGTIQLVHVIELPVMHDTVLMPVLNFEEQLLKELRQKANEQFQKLSDKYSREGVKVKWEVDFGVPSKTILDVITAEAIDLVIMGSHGASGLREYFIGSNAEKMIRKAPVPVLITKDYYKGPIKNIVFPNTLDTENQSELIAKVKALQNFFGAHLHLVWINTPLNFTSDVVTQQRLHDFAKRFAFKDYSVNIFNHPNEEEGIIHFTQFVKGDIIAMGTHGRKGLTHLINGSVAEDVANHTESLLWTYTLKNEPVES